MGFRSGNNSSFHFSFWCQLQFAFFLLEMALSMVLLAQKQDEGAVCWSWSSRRDVGAELAGTGSAVCWYPGGFTPCLLPISHICTASSTESYPKGPCCVRAELAAVWTCSYLDNSAISWGLCSPGMWGSDSGKFFGAFTVMVSWTG